MTAIGGGTVTLLFTDIEGSTRLLRELGNRYEKVLDDHRRLLREAFAAQEGTEVDTAGDGFFYAFPRARNAMNGRCHCACGWACTPVSRSARRPATSGWTCTARPGS
jgi:class 3 adenylate cyclase